MLGSRTLRREELAAHKALLADSAGLALLVFLEKIGSRQAARVRIAHVRGALRPGRFHRGAIAIGDKAARKPPGRRACKDYPRCSMLTSPPSQK